MAECGGRLDRARSVPRGQRVPYWTASIRVGAPAALAEGLPWPYDVERSGLERGARQLLLREWHSVTAAENDATALSHRGFAVQVVRPSDGDGARVFASGERALVDEAVGIDAVVRSVASDWADAVAWMGDALGYPRCCVARFSRIRSRTDLGLFVDLLDALGAPAAPAESVWLDGALALVSHAPCSPSCSPTRERASAVLAALDDAHAGFAETWRAWGSAVHAIDDEGRMLWLDVDGLITPGSGGSEPLAARVRSARHLAPSVDPDASMPTVVEQPALVGAALALRRDRVCVDGVGDVFLLADHRGSPPSA